MIKIGDFARLSQVSIVTLRHYDEIGLLTPMAVDTATGHRYYAVAQLTRLNRILALKDLGFSLDQIDQLLEGLTAEHLCTMLHRQQVAVEGQVAEARERLTRIGTWLRQIEREKTMTDDAVVLKTIPAQLIASRRVTIPTNDQVPVYLGAAYEEVATYVTQQGARETGACFALWHQPAAVHAGEIAEAVLPIDRRVPGTERIAVYDLPHTQVAAAVHQGAFEDFTRVHATLLDWVEANGYRVVGPYREIYMQHSPGMADAATEIQYPVEKAL